jgi:lysophospholipase L1-like esterase
VTSRDGAGRTPARALVSSVLVPCGIAILLLAALEGGCRLAGRVRTGSWPLTRAEARRAFVERVGAAYTRHPYLDVAGRPHGEIHVPSHTARLNRFGQRGGDPAMPKPGGTFRIVCEGGSATFDLLARDDASAWPARLGRQLAARGVDVVNSGLAGWTTVESLVSLELRDVDLSPDLVVVLAGANDLQPAGHVPFARDYALGHGELLPRVLGIAPIPLRLASRSLFVETLLDRLRGAPRETLEGWAPSWEWKGARRDDVPAEALEVFARNLRSTVAVARAHGARTLLLAQTVRIRRSVEAPDRAWVESWAPGLTSEGYVRALARYGDAARSVAEATGALFLDPFAGGAFTDGDFGDPLHFSAAGSEKLADALAGWVGERLDALRRASP